MTTTIAIMCMQKGPMQPVNVYGSGDFTNVITTSTSCCKSGPPESRVTNALLVWSKLMPATCRQALDIFGLNSPGVRHKYAWCCRWMRPLGSEVYHNKCELFMQGEVGAFRFTFVTLLALPAGDRSVNRHLCR